MRKSFLSFVFLFLLLTLSTHAQQTAIAGAWRLSAYEGDGNDGEGELVVIYSADYFMFGHFRDDGSFIKAAGGNYSLQADQQVELIYDFHTEDSSLVRQPQQYSVRSEGQSMVLEGGGEKRTFNRIDSGNSPLAGAWRFAARIDEEGNPGERRGEGPRQTIKILSGERFQWAAFNYETKQFSGTGGGTYELSDGQYIETIEFFSRDNSRVGMSLEFSYRIEGDDWYHKGHGSTGKPVHEIWERK